MINNNSPCIYQVWTTSCYFLNQLHVLVRPFLAIFGVTESNKSMSSFFWSYGSKDELVESYCSYMPHNKRDKLNNTAHNSSNIAVIDEDARDKDEYGVYEPEIVAVAEDNEDEDYGERQDTHPAESDNASTIQ